MAALRAIIEEEMARREAKAAPKKAAPQPAQAKPPVKAPTKAPEAKGPEPKPQAMTAAPAPQIKPAPAKAAPVKTAQAAPSPAPKAQKDSMPPHISTPTNFMTCPDPGLLTEQIVQIAQRSAKMLSAFMARNKTLMDRLPNVDPANMGEAFKEFVSQILSKPDKLVETHIAFWQDYVKLLQATLARAAGQEAAPVITADKADRRFKDPAWQEIWVFDFLKQSYLLMARWAQAMVEQTDGLDPKIAHKIEFYTRQMIDAMSPSNFMLTNPEVLRTTIETGGENLIKGLENLLDDMERGQGQLLISMSDNSAFHFAENIATTKGKVVYQNELMQLIQFAPLTDKVHKTPLLIVPPWINKYYILDLKPENSFIRYLVEQGHTVFIISWVNPDHRHAEMGFDDYMTLGPIMAAQEIAKITGEKNVNTVGYCIGGTLLAATLAYLAGAGDKKPKDMPNIASATYLVTMIDFEEPGDLGVFVDEGQISLIESMMEGSGYLHGSVMATTFAMLRANDLIWSFVVNNYLMGREPFPFDLLTWNSDSTNLPAKMQSYYLRNMYLENNFIQPGGTTMKDVPIDLRKIKVPTFCLSTHDDHITPWRSTYVATQTYSGPVTFCLSGSGHIAGVVNPPAKEKYNYWTNAATPANPDEWMKGAENHKGSWWPEWIKWLGQYAGDMTDARDPAANANAIEDAPGSYVRMKVV